MSAFGAASERALDTRFTTVAAPGDAAGDVRAGFVFGPRALRRWLGRSLPVPTADRHGHQRIEFRRFVSDRTIADVLVQALNGSFARAGIASRMRTGAIARLAGEEVLPRGAHPGAWLADLCEGRVATGHGALPLECWCAAAGVNCAFVLVDWDMSRTRIERGHWAGFAPRAPTHGDGALRFAPVLIADLRCALTAHTAAHEFGHVLGCGHDNVANLLAPSACGFVRRNARFSVMAAARRDERGRHLEWSRPGPGGEAWDFGDGAHDEVAWLKEALPLLARQRFRCARACNGMCGTGTRPTRGFQPTDAPVI